MSVFAMAADAIFSDPHLSQDAVWRAGGSETGPCVRVRRRAPEAIVGVGDNRYDLNAMLLQVRLSEVAAPAERDQVDLLDEAGGIAMTVEVTGLSSIDTRGLVRTCEVSPLAPAEDEP